jgi:glycosyltransferase involved in cell wall biosynthesis
MHNSNLRYVLITAARNEASLIEDTIRSVIAQTVRPVKWVIVSDGSTDRTDGIVKRHAAQHDWIELVRMPEHADRQFAAKVRALRAAYEKVQMLQFEIIGNLDADITFDSGYMAFLLHKLAGDPALGVVGTRFIENAKQVYDYALMNENHVSGGCQVFRRKCFEDIGGYLPLRRGGEDWAAVTSARMKGWRTESYSDKLYVHHRPMGTCGQSLLRARFRQGESDYLTGGHPLWQFFRSAFQMSQKPYFLGGLCLFLGFGWALVRRADRPVPRELMLFHRAEQMTRLRRLVFSSAKRA